MSSAAHPIHDRLAQLAQQREFAQCLAQAQAHVGLQAEDAVAWGWLARSAFALGDGAMALEAAQRVCELQPGNAQAWTTLGDVRRHLGQLDNALAAFQQALQLVAAATPPTSQSQAALAVLSNKVGDVLYTQGQFEPAQKAFEQAVYLAPCFGQAWFHLGIARMGLGHYAQAQAPLEQALAHGHPPAQAQSALGAVFLELGAHRQAHAALSQALALQPEDTMVLNNLSIASQNLGLLAEAEALIRRKLALQGRDVNGWINLGNVLRAQARLDEAVGAFRHAMSLEAGNATGLMAMGLLCHETQALADARRYLSEAVASPAATQAQRLDAMVELASLHATMGEHGASETLFMEVLSARPHERKYWGKWLFALNNHPFKTPHQILEQYQAFATQCFGAATPLPAAAAPPRLAQAEKRRIHIGYVSADFTQHPVRLFLQPLLAHHDHTRFEVSAFANLSGPAEVLPVYQTMVDHWHFTKGMTDHEVAEQVRNSCVDVLVDLSGHTGGNRLDVFALKPAPVAMSWLGFGSSTGLAAIDYFLTDTHAVPAQDDAYFAEQAWRLDRPFLVYRPTAGMGDPGPLPALAAGHITFATLSRSIRFNDELFAAWAQVLLRVPGSVLRIDSKNMRDANLVRQTQARFAAMGIGVQRIQCGFHSPPWDVLRSVDVSLDCFPHNSGTTLLESLYMGVPYVTLSDRPGVGRLGAAILQGVGRPEWVAHTVQEYVDKAVALASDLPRLAQVRASLREAMVASPLMDEAGFARSVEEAYTRMLESRGQGVRAESGFLA
ncbi:putative O-linked N-acetylglucosamine transferase, SPINDLY family [Acidovorax sp. CF316]|uniref:tetratricopeptide repeat protein n=1 Tax=Acidovorax sp. CF316 TaxID=1144317 RepID=UPI00026BCEEE|nr:tetratricopeptide repeat protein [Acidovorax sp. CF316]EJE53724.1 putative O-linked N-acetylglucosamine transferase, SPINDLY family [Acidovorax sp. CF316]